jgi:K+-sensing histidine kinase KdpD
MTSRARTGLAVALGALGPLALAAAWIPIRIRLPNTDLALILVLGVVAVGAWGRRSAVVTAAVSASLWFEFFDTKPFERLAIARQPDLETTVVLAVVSFVAGEMAVWIVRQRARRIVESAEMGSLREAAGLLAMGEELVMVIQSVAGELSRLLGLADCTFETEDPDPARATLRRDGTLVGARQPTEAAPISSAELPVWGQGERLGYYVLEFAPGPPPERERLLVAVTLADQVGAAFMAQAPPTAPPDPTPPTSLRVVR